MGRDPCRSRSGALLLGLTVGLNGWLGQSKYGVPDSGAQAEYGVADTAWLDGRRWCRLEQQRR